MDKKEVKAIEILEDLSKYGLLAIITTEYRDAIKIGVKLIKKIEKENKKLKKENNKFKEQLIDLMEKVIDNHNS